MKICRLLVQHFFQESPTTLVEGTSTVKNLEETGDGSSTEL